jgi:single stranded DNA-binding protein
VGGSEESKQKVDHKEPTQEGRARRLLFSHSLKEHTMAFVRVEQRNARLAAPVRLETVKGREGSVSKGTVTIISNVRHGSGEDEATSIQWTLWGRLAENAAEYLGKGSRVNVVGRLQNNNYQNAQGETVYALTFTCEEIDYLDTRADAEARRARQEGGKTAGGDARAKAGKATPADMPSDEDVPF